MFAEPAFMNIDSKSTSNSESEVVRKIEKGLSFFSFIYFSTYFTSCFYVYLHKTNIPFFSYPPYAQNYFYIYSKTYWLQS